MASFSDQLAAAKAAHQAVAALESVARREITTAFSEWQSGELDAQTVRHRLEAIVRKSYRSAAAIGSTLASNQSGLPGWHPQGEVFRTDYLDALLKDIRKNLREYKKSDQGEAALRRATSRMQHSAGVAAERGYTDSIIGSYKELADFGYDLRKIWLANFVDNQPCPECTRLHGQEVELEAEFEIPTLTKTKIYHNLQGPPRHPRCQCYIVVLVVTLENVLEHLDLDKPTPAPQMMDSHDVKSLPAAVFKAVVKTLQTLIRKLRGR